MILQDTLCQIKELLTASGYFNKVYELVERTISGDSEFPGIYVGAGNYNNVFDLDVGGMAYIRKGSPAAIANSNKQELRASCNNESDRLKHLRYYLRIVSSVPKSKLEDNAFSSELLIERILKLLSSGFSISNSAGSYIEPISFETDPYSVWGQEAAGLEFKIDKAKTLVALDIVCNIHIKASCLIPECEPYAYS